MKLMVDIENMLLSLFLALILSSFIPFSLYSLAPQFFGLMFLNLLGLVFSPGLEGRLESHENSDSLRLKINT